MKKPKAKRKKKAAPKHIEIHAPLKLHIHPEIVPVPTASSGVYVWPPRQDHDSLAAQIKHPNAAEIGAIKVIEPTVPVKQWWEFWK